MIAGAPQIKQLQLKQCDLGTIKSAVALVIKNKSGVQIQCVSTLKISRMISSHTLKINLQIKYSDHSFSHYSHLAICALLMAILKEFVIKKYFQRL